jgi:multidrug resistance efflux pump
MEDKEIQNYESGNFQVIPEEFPSENTLVIEHLQKMPNIFSRGLIYIIVLFMFTGLLYSLLGKIDVVAECQAIVRPMTHKIRIISDRSGYLEQIYITEGQEVKQDAPLFLIRSRELLQHDAEVRRIKLEQNLSALKSVESELSYWRSEVNRLSREFKNFKDLFEKKIISRMELDKKRSELGKAQTEWKKLNSKKEITLNENMILEEELKKAEEEKQKTILAENSGIISELYFKNEGEYIRESDLLCTIVPVDSPLYMDIKVANRDIGFIEKNMDIKYKFDAFPFMDYGILRGKVTAIPPSAVEDEMLGWVYYVQGDLDKNHFFISNKEYPIRVGMTATAELIIERKSIFARLFRNARGKS